MHRGLCVPAVQAQTPDLDRNRWQTRKGLPRRRSGWPHVLSPSAGLLASVVRRSLAAGSLYSQRVPLSEPCFPLSDPQARPSQRASCRQRPQEPLLLVQGWLSTAQYSSPMLLHSWEHDAMLHAWSRSSPHGSSKRGTRLLRHRFLLPLSALLDSLAWCLPCGLSCCSLVTCASGKWRPFHLGATAFIRTAL